jgi:CheY-like chemotaxis protein
MRPPHFPDASGVQAAPRRILIIEDHADNRESLRCLLELWGYGVQVARDGVQGSAKALARHPDVAVIDIGLPRKDGYEVARQLRAALHDDIRLIALTADSDPEDRDRAAQAGFDYFMTKPADLEELHRLLG